MKKDRAMGLLMSLTRETDNTLIAVPKAAVVNIEPLQGKPGTRISLINGAVDVAEDVATVAAAFEAN